MSVFAPQDRQLTQLRRRHWEIESEISSKIKRPLPDHTRISSLKRRKLALKDKMLVIARTSRPIQEIRRAG
jgi:hypothetical protein